MSAEQKNFSFETVAVLCAVLQSNGGTIGTAYYDLMSACDGKRTACSFQHEFRAVLKRAREIKDKMGEAGALKPVAPMPKGGRSKKNGSSTSGKKRGQLPYSSMSSQVLIRD